MLLSVKYVETFLNNFPESPLKRVTEIFLRNWKSTENDLKEFNNLLKQQAEICLFEKTYRSVPGIGKIASRVLANELGDMSQFKNEKSLFSYVGLTPSEHSSGEKVIRGQITRQGTS